MKSCTHFFSAGLVNVGGEILVDKTVVVDSVVVIVDEEVSVIASVDEQFSVVVFVDEGVSVVKCGSVASVVSDAISVVDVHVDD